MARRSYAGGAQPTTLASSINSTTTVVSAVALIGWPIPTHPFFAVIDRDTPSEEKVLCSSVNGNDVTVIRGQDGTVARDHAAGAPFEHCHTATDADEANDHVNNTRAHGVPVGDDFLFRKAAQTVENKALDFGVAGGNVASNIPIPSVAGLPQALDEALNDLNAYLPVGSIAMFGGDVAPAGWLICDGSILQVNQYPDLAQVLSSTYGGNGTTTFGLPNLQGRFPVGRSADAEFASLGLSGGVKTVTLTEQQIPSHKHQVPTHTHTQAAHTHTQDPHLHSVNPPSFTTPSGGVHNHVLEMREPGSSVATVGKGGGPNPDTNGGPVLGTNSAHTHVIDMPAFNSVNATAVNDPTTPAINDKAAFDVTNTGGGQAHDNLPPFLTINFMIRALKAT
jgi:microcystin-dependent protein